MAKSLLLAFAFLYIRHFIAFSPPLFPWTPLEPPGKAHKTLDISFAIFFSCLHFMTFSLALRGRYKREEFPLDFPHALTFYSPPTHCKIGNICVMRFSLLAGKCKISAFFVSFVVAGFSSIIPVFLHFIFSFFHLFNSSCRGIAFSCAKTSCRIYVAARIFAAATPLIRGTWESSEKWMDIYPLVFVWFSSLFPKVCYENCTKFQHLILAFSMQDMSADERNLDMEPKEPEISNIFSYFLLPTSIILCRG